MTERIEINEAAILRWPTSATREWLRQCLRAATDDSNVLAIVAVGSSVRVNAQSEDLDLVVVCNDRHQFQCKPPIEVDIRAFDRNTVNQELEAGHPLLGWAVIFGRAIFDRNGTWDEVSVAWRDRVPLPDPVIARERAAKVRKHLCAVKEIGDDVATAELNVSYVTLLARAALAEHHVYPASRPELPDQLRGVGEALLAGQLQAALRQRGRILSKRAS